MKRKIIILFVIILTFVLLNSQSRIPQEDCCYQIWAAGCNLGWSTSLMFYTQIRQRWSRFDQPTYDMILLAGRHIESAYRACSSGAKAWPGWRGKRQQLNNIARSFSQRPDSFNRKRLYNQLYLTYRWASGLSWAVMASRLVKTPTCSEKYFKLGWLIANAQQTLKIADESYRQGGRNYYDWRSQVADAKRSLATASTVLYNYFRLRPVTGSCVNIKDLNIKRKLKEIGRLGSTYVNLQYMIKTVDWIRINLENRLRRRCSTRRSTHPTSPDPGPKPTPLTDVTVNRIAVTMSVWDHGSEDGDRVDIYLNNRLIKRNLMLKKAVTNIRLSLYTGTNNIEVRALNEGKSSPNTASMKITNVIKGRSKQQWKLKTGQSGKMRISVSY